VTDWFPYCRAFNATHKNTSMTYQSAFYAGIKACTQYAINKGFTKARPLPPPPLPIFRASHGKRVLVCVVCLLMSAPLLQVITFNPRLDQWPGGLWRAYLPVRGGTRPSGGALDSRRCVFGGFASVNAGKGRGRLATLYACHNQALRRLQFDPLVNYGGPNQSFYSTVLQPLANISRDLSGKVATWQLGLGRRQCRHLPLGVGVTSPALGGTAAVPLLEAAPLRRMSGGSCWPVLPPAGGEHMYTITSYPESYIKAMGMLKKINAGAAATQPWDLATHQVSSAGMPQEPACSPQV
jgi:hypothetical protein